MKGSSMRKLGKRYVEPCTSEELKTLASGDRASLKAIAKDKRDLGEFQQFIAESQSTAEGAKRELTVPRRFSFTVYDGVSARSRTQRKVVVKAGTVLYFFVDSTSYFTFNEGNHSWVVNLATSEVRFHENNVATHVLAHAPTMRNRMG
jgi:hypothetical protein